MADTTKTCRECLADIPEGARKCRHCGSEQSRAAPAARGVAAFVAAVVAGLALAYLAVMLIWG